MTDLARTLSTFALALVCALTTGCGDEFTAGFSTPGMLDSAGSPPEAGAAGEGDAPPAGAAGAPAAGSGGSAAAASAAGGEDAGGAGPSAGAAGSAPAVAPCESAVDVSGGYLALQSDRHCYRTQDHFSMLLCGAWGARSLKVNGAPAECNARIDLKPASDGYNYFELSAESTGSAWLRWLEYTPPVPCEHPLTLTGESGPLPAGPVCIRTQDPLNEVLTGDADGRSLVINGFQTSYNYQTGVPPTADGYNYLAIGPGKAGVSVSWALVPMGPS